MAIICPTVLAGEPHEFREQMERVARFAGRVQIDLTDGDFAAAKSVELEKVWWPEHIDADIHLMYQAPDDYLGLLAKMKPKMVIFHYEADVDHSGFARELRRYGIRAGLALLGNTAVESAADLLPDFDHLLIFSGDLGRFGGDADMNLLDKAARAKVIKPDIEVGWDGGINDKNIKRIADGGIDVLNVGGFIQQSSDPRAAYVILEELIAKN